MVLQSRMAEAMALRDQVLYSGLNFYKQGTCGIECVAQIMDASTSVGDYYHPFIL